MLCSNNCLRLTKDRRWMACSLLSLFYPHTNLSSTPLYSLHVQLDLLPLHPGLAVSRLLLSRHFTDTPTETSDLISGRKSEGSSSSCESNPTHLYIFDSGEGRAPRGHGGVESPCLRVSHYQTMPHHHCLRRTVGMGSSFSGRRTISGQMVLNPGVLTSPALSSSDMAVEQCGGRAHFRKERSKEEGGFHK